MLIRWNQGTSTIQALLDEGRLQNVQPDRSLADVLLKQAELHIETARTAAASDVVGAFQLAYDA
ncbi:MAG: hypothetical protein LBL01_03665, partial [Bifidobacteriaceae bacterium]|nr:hypothetical protein [Bifidobacteriaceae bacterium]